MKSRNIFFIALLFITGALTPTFAKAPSTTAPTDTRPPGQTKTRWPVSKSPVREVVLGSNDNAGDFKLQVRLTSLGAAVKTAKLTDFFATVADKRRCKRENNHAAYLKAVAEDVKLEGHYSLLNPVITGDRTFYPMATRRITIITGDERIALDLSGPRWLAGEVQTEENEKGEIQSQSVTFQAKIQRNEEEILLLKKTYTLKVGDYSIDIRMEAQNPRKDSKVEFSLTQFLATGLSKEDVRGDNRTLAYGLFEDGKVKVESLSSRDIGKMEVGLANKRGLGRSDVAEPVLWAGQTNKFFAALTYIIPEDSGKLSAPAAQASFFGAALEETGQLRTSLAGMNLGPYELKGGGSTDVRLDLFVGPKKRNLFDDSPLYQNLGYKETLQTGACFCAFQPLTLGMMWLLDFFSGSVTMGNYGLAIILLVILVRICLHPLMKKQQVSMMRMQKLQPEMEKVKKK
ncbi:MAG: YidC/Oxa1 family insertase periplasmic-domain containing protein [Phycisphaerae bacterium]|nr:YidC/Oxa1 family insertase periplasmic-domain containing protein [Phycisphaerae bacterium]